MKQWFVAYTKPLAEELAARHLANQGFESYLPRYAKERRHARRVERVEVPLFPRYLFVSIDSESHRWRSINGTVGVDRLVCQGDLPLPVSDAVIASIRARENGDGIVDLEEEGFALNQPLRVLDGPMAELIGLFQRMADSQRAILLLRLLGRDLQVSLPRVLVQPV